MIDFKQFKEHVVIPTLKYLDSEVPYSEEAVDLLMMTCAHESKGGTYLRQKGMTGDKGAFGVYQMENATHEDIYDHFLSGRGSLERFVLCLSYDLEDEMDCFGLYEQMVTNLAYATAMARVHYWRVAEALPSKDDTRYLPLLGEYAKKYYNTHLGKATASKYVMDYLDWRDS
tara:strand:- start:1656 stop:2171 length:516 start_codon:yes stop_codon:yes gene_type:complete